MKRGRKNRKMKRKKKTEEEKKHNRKELGIMTNKNMYMYIVYRQKLK